MARIKIGATLLMLSITIGCDTISDVLPNSVKDKAEEVQASVSDTVGDAASKAVETVKEVAQTAGSAEIMLNREVQAGRCYASLHQPGENRPAILQLKSYRFEADESFPTFLFHAESPTGSWNELVGQEVTGQLFLQQQADGEVWYTQPDGLLTVKVISNQDGNVEAELISGTLVSTSGKTQPAASGKFHAVLAD